MKIRQIIILGLLILGLGLMKPNSVLASYACVGGDPCMETRSVDAPIGCDQNASGGHWCEDQYWTGTYTIVIPIADIQ